MTSCVSSNITRVRTLKREICQISQRRFLPRSCLQLSLANPAPYQCGLTATEKINKGHEMHKYEKVFSQHKTTKIFGMVAALRLFSLFVATIITDQPRKPLDDLTRQEPA